MTLSKIRVIDFKVNTPIVNLHQRIFTLWCAIVGPQQHTRRLFEYNFTSYPCLIKRHPFYITSSVPSKQLLAYDGPEQPFRLFDMRVATLIKKLMMPLNMD